MIKGFIATLSLALFMLVCVAADETIGKSKGSPYGDYEREYCKRVCYRKRPYCGKGWHTRLVGSCYTCCTIKQKYVPYEDEPAMEMEQDHDMNINDKQIADDANLN